MKNARKQAAGKRRLPPATLAFRPDNETREALRTISLLRPDLDTSSMLREAIRAYARELELAGFVEACRKRGKSGVAIVEEFERAGDA